MILGSVAIFAVLGLIGRAIIRRRRRVEIEPVTA